MAWTYIITDENNAEIYDHNDEHVTTAMNNDPPSVRIRNGVPTDPDVKGAVREYLLTEMAEDDDNEPASVYIIKGMLHLSAGNIEER